MYSVKIITGFNSAHRLMNYKGKCENLHGHNWKVEVAVSSEKLDNGMLMDFKDLKRMTGDIISDLDHRYLNDMDFFKDENPTSENIAYYIASKLKPAISGKGITALEVSVWETDTSIASYREDVV